jgi:YbgC/YbaW family acyl-CoA thioester hydrolase
VHAAASRVRLIAVDREEALQLLARLQTAQNRFYSGGDEGELRSLLAPEVVWHVPGRNAIAGTYRGHDEVIAYFTRRRSLAGNTFRITRRDVLTGDGNTIAALTDGEATFEGQTQRWSTIGLYRVVADKVAECWLMPTDPDLFDRIWSLTEYSRGEGGHNFSLRVAPRYCDAQGMVHASRYYEFFEDAFLSWLDHTCGGYLQLQATGGDLVLVENGCSYRHPARQSEVITIDVDPLWVKRSSFCVAFHVRHGQLDLAEGRSVYVFVKKGMPAPVPTLLNGALAGAKARVAG